jgi:uracil-DNA glycosylase
MSWTTLYPKGITSLPIPTDPSWAPFFKEQEPKLQAIYRELNKLNFKTLLPCPEDVFRAMILIPLDKIKVVLLGQDPYHTIEKTPHGQIILATGLSFSVPSEAKTPSSLQNIYNNLIKFKHIESKGNGDLEHWCDQGCLLLNTSLTVTQGAPNSHKYLWVDFTQALIKYISDNTQGVVFMLWGRESLDKLAIIDTNKHFATISSHPSGLSYSKKMGIYDAFMNTDHFGAANNYLKSHGKEPIKW